MNRMNADTDVGISQLETCEALNVTDCPKEQLREAMDRFGHAQKKSPSNHSTK